MKIIVTTKRVTDPDIKVTVNSDGTGIDLQDMTYKMNPFDEIAVEEAVRIKENSGGEVILLSIGPAGFQTEIRAGLAMGADRAIQVEHDDYVEPSVAARIFKKVIERESPDIVLMGKQAVDDDAGQTGQTLAFLLGWPQACFASEISINKNSAVVRREVDKGIETLEVSLPAVITADLRLNEPRYPSLPMIMKSKKKKIDTLSFSELAADIEPRVRYLSMENPMEREGSCVLFEAVDDLINALQTKAGAIR